MNNYKKSFWVFIIPAMLLKFGLVLTTLGFVLNSMPFLTDSGLTNALSNSGVPALFWGVVLGIPLGLLTKHFSNQARQANSANQQEAFTQSIAWTAFFCPFFWALVNRQYKKIIPAFIPVYNLYVGAQLAIHGRAESWAKGGWNNFDQFKRRQTMLRWLLPLVYVVAVAGALGIIILYILLFAAVGTAMNFGDVLLKVGTAAVSGLRH